MGTNSTTLSWITNRSYIKHYACLYIPVWFFNHPLLNFLWGKHSQPTKTRAFKDTFYILFTIYDLRNEVAFHSRNNSQGDFFSFCFLIIFDISAQLGILDIESTLFFSRCWNKFLFNVSIETLNRVNAKVTTETCTKCFIIFPLKPHIIRSWCYFYSFLYPFPQIFLMCGTDEICEFLWWWCFM